MQVGKLREVFDGGVKSVPSGLDAADHDLVAHDHAGEQVARLNLDPVLPGYLFWGTHENHDGVCSHERHDAGNVVRISSRFEDLSEGIACLFQSFGGNAGTVDVLVFQRFEYLRPQVIGVPSAEKGQPVAVQGQEKSGHDPHWPHACYQCPGDGAFQFVVAVKVVPLAELHCLMVGLFRDAKRCQKEC